MTKTIISIEGGLGRCIAAIPALLKYEKLNRDKEWYVMFYLWDFITWGIPELQSRTFNPDGKGIFENYYWDADEVISPEPYRVPEYYRNEISLREAFDIAINNSYDHSDLPSMQFNLSKEEIRRAHEIIGEVKNSHKKEKTVVLQPYGSAAMPHPTGVVDNTLRSMPKPFLDFLIPKLLKNYNVIYMGAHEFHDSKTFKPDPNPSLREWAAIISECDYFIGCDTCGQHMRMCFDKDASVMIAGTHEKNTSYPEKFHIIKKDLPFQPDAMRVSMFQYQLSTRLNEERLNFTIEEMEKAYQEIVQRIES
jgi:hypothetical protein